MAVKSYWSFPACVEKPLCRLLHLEILMCADTTAVTVLVCWFWSNCVEFAAHISTSSPSWKRWATTDTFEKAHVCILLSHARLHSAGLTYHTATIIERKWHRWQKWARAANLSVVTLGKLFFWRRSCVFQETFAIFAAHSPSCHHVRMINVKLSDRIPVPTSPKGDKR